MQKLITAIYGNWAKQIHLAIAIFLLFVLTYFFLGILNRVPPNNTHYLPIVSIVLFCYLLPTSIAWTGHRLISVFVFAPIASATALLAVSATGEPQLILFIVYQLVLCAMLFVSDQRKSSVVTSVEVDVEKATNEHNDLEIAYRDKGTSISVFFDKYTSYYNLRNLASDFSSTLSLNDLSKIVVSKCMKVLQKGDACALLLSEPGTDYLSLLATQSIDSGKPMPAKGGDLLDMWVVRNRKSLFVQDLQKDFRFDLKEAEKLDAARSMIGSPIIHGGKAVGVLRMQSAKPGAFSTDDLRILDAVSTLASSAMLNSILFRRTEDLAIKDSLTNLFVQRHFMTRLTEEHRRSLITNAPLTLLMCDLDHFKQKNDKYGHGIGDLILVKTAEILRDKSGDAIVARYGGEEFAILMPKATSKEGCILAEAIRASLKEMNLIVRREIIPVTISIGVASVPADTLDSEELIRCADKRLYSAKRGGRDQICCEG